jgi:hypothetical protein
MTRDEFMTRLAELYVRNVEISKAKNSDYAGGSDPFKNFRAAEFYGVPVERALLIRMSDKMSRISNLLDREAAVTDESLGDTCSDLANYAMILRMWLEQRGKA